VAFFFNFKLNGLKRNKYALSVFGGSKFQIGGCLGIPTQLWVLKEHKIDVCVNFLGQSCCHRPDPKICEGKCPKANILLAYEYDTNGTSGAEGI
jgi:hypothetical protein